MLMVLEKGKFEVVGWCWCNSSTAPNSNLLSSNICCYMVNVIVAGKHFISATRKTNTQWDCSLVHFRVHDHRQAWEVATYSYSLHWRSFCWSNLRNVGTAVVTVTTLLHIRSTSSALLSNHLTIDNLHQELSIDDGLVIVFSLDATRWSAVFISSH